MTAKELIYELLFCFALILIFLYILFGITKEVNDQVTYYKSVRDYKPTPATYKYYD